MLAPKHPASLAHSHAAQSVEGRSCQLCEPDQDSTEPGWNYLIHGLVCWLSWEKLLQIKNKAFFVFLEVDYSIPMKGSNMTQTFLFEYLGARQPPPEVQSAVKRGAN